MFILCCTAIYYVCTTLELVFEQNKLNVLFFVFSKISFLLKIVYKVLVVRCYPVAFSEMIILHFSH